MIHVVFVAPYFGQSMLHALACLCALEDVKLGVITQEPQERIPQALKPRIDGHYRVANAQDAGDIITGARAFQKEWGRIDRLLGYLEQLTLPLAQARDALGIEGLRSEGGRRFRDKNRMKAVLREHGLPVARQALVTCADDLRRFVAEVGYPIVLKPLAGLGTRDTQRVLDEDDMYVALNRMLPTAERPCQAEEFVAGEEHTCESVTLGGKVVWSSSTYYLPGPLQVLENPWMQYCVLLPREQYQPHFEAFRPLNAKALSVLGMEDGLSHMEWFLTKSGRAVISEVAARPPGVNIMAMNGIAADVDFWAKWARLMVHKTWDMPERRYACGCAFLRGQGGGRTLAAVEGLEETLRDLGPAVVSARLPKAGQPRSSHYEGEGWIIVKNDTTQGAIDALRAIVTRIQLRYA